MPRLSLLPVANVTPAYAHVHSIGEAHQRDVALAPRLFAHEDQLVQPILAGEYDTIVHCIQQSRKGDGTLLAYLQRIGGR